MKLPFWLVIENKHIPDPPDHLPCNDPFAPHAFWTTQELSAYLSERKSGRWELTLVSDKRVFLLAIEDVTKRGATHICFDPEPDGSGGELTSIIDLRAAHDDGQFSA